LKAERNSNDTLLFLRVIGTILKAFAIRHCGGPIRASTKESCFKSHSPSNFFDSKIYKSHIAEFFIGFKPLLPPASDNVYSVRARVT